MKTKPDSNERYYLGMISKVEDRVLYKVRVTIDNVVDDAMAFPLRGEVDEPKVGDMVLLYNIDDLFQSCYLYSKIKEDKFIGFRSNGKLISITPESITMMVYDTSEDANEDKIDSFRSKIVMNSDGTVEIESKSSMTVKSPDITIKGPGTLRVNSTGVANPGTPGPFVATTTTPPEGMPFPSSDTIMLK